VHDERFEVGFWWSGACEVEEQEEEDEDHGGGV